MAAGGNFRSLTPLRRPQPFPTVHEGMLTRLRCDARFADPAPQAPAHFTSADLSSALRTGFER
jgi:hypothetical protein